jgi:hypothetical protein
MSCRTPRFSMIGTGWRSRKGALCRAQYRS